MKISRLKTNEQLELNGAWYDLGEGARLLIARENNPNFNTALRRAMAPYKSKAQRALLSDSRAEEIQNEVLADTILLGWENLQDDDGSEISYNRENAIRLLAEYKEFKGMVIEFSQDIDNYRTQHEGEVKDNLKK